MRRNLIIVGFILIHLSLTGLEMEKWKEDILFLKNELPKRHKEFFYSKSVNSFDKEISKLLNSIEKLNDFQISIRLQQIISSYGDSHTNANWFEFVNSNMKVPVKLYWFKDGLYIIKASPANKHLLGKKLFKINGYEMKTITDSLATVLTNDNQAIAKNNIPNLIPLIQLLQYFGFVANNGKINIEIENDDKIYEIDTDNSNNNWESFTPDSMAYCWLNERQFFTEKFFPKDNIYYIQYNVCWSKEVEQLYGDKQKSINYPSFNEFEEKVLHTLSTKHIDKVIFDLRYNSGGYSLQGSELIEKISKIKNVNQRGKLFVVIGRKTFSSAIINTMDFMNTTEAILVGEETGGKPNHFGEVKSFKLPNSSLTINYSTKYFKRENKNLSTISPEILIEYSFDDFKTGNDKIYNLIRDH